MYIQIKKVHTFVHTNFIMMKIEDEIKSTVELSLAKKVLLNLSYTRNVVGDCFLEILKPYDLSGEQYNVLRILRGQKGKPANMACIQERMVAKTSNTTRLVDKLLNKELVIRKVCPDNRRKMEITITDKGLAVLAELDPKVIEHENAFAAKLSASELLQLNELLEKYRS